MNSPATFAALLEAAKSRHTGGDLAGAEMAYRQLVQMDPRNHEAIHLLGVIAAQRNDYPEALRLMQESIAIFGGSANYFKNLGHTLFYAQQFDAAVGAFRQCIALGLNDPQVYLDLGVCLKTLGNNGEALLAFERAEALNPHHPLPPFNLGVIYRDKGEPARAKEMFQRALALKPDFGPAADGLEEAEEKLLAQRNLDAAYGPLPPTPSERPSVREMAEVFATQAGWGNFTQTPSSLKQFQFLLEAGNSAQPSDVVLDISAGQGFNKVFFRHTQYAAIDLTIGDSQWDYSKLDLIGDALSLPVQDASADICLNFVSLEHYPDPQQAFAEFARVLKPGGTLYLSAPFVYTEHQIPHDYFRFTRYGLAHLCEKNGLEVVSISPDRGLYSTALQWMNISVKSIKDRKLRQEILDYLDQRVRPVFEEIERDPGQVVDFPTPPQQEQFATRYDLIARKPGEAPPSPSFATRPELIAHLAACPACRSGQLDFGESAVLCRRCHASYPYLNGIPVLLPQGRTVQAINHLNH